MLRDALHALRYLRKNPGFAVPAIATLALGVGATVAVFTVVNGVLIRPLPYRDPERIEMIWITDRNPDGTSYELPLTSGFFNDIQRQASHFEKMAAFRFWPYSLTTAGESEAEPLSGSRVSPELFDVLGVRPIAGQTFTREHAVPGAPNVAVISYDLWQRRFGGDLSIVGRQVRLSGQSFTVTGVMPPGFAFPRGAELPAPFGFGLRTDIWTPLVFDASDLNNRLGAMNLSAIGRLKAGIAPVVARAELSGIMQRFLAANAPNLRFEYTLVSIANQAARGVRRGLLILLGAVVFVLLIATANVASLLVARVTGRTRELAVRAAIGAGRGRLARQLATENMVLGVLGVGLGVVLSHWATKVMLSLVPGSMPRADDIGLDWRVLIAAAFLALIVGAVFGIAASASVSLTQISQTLRAGDAQSTGGLKRRYGRRMLVASEVALSLILLIGALLLTRSFVKLQRIQPGFDATNVLTATVGLPIAGPFRPLIDGPVWSATFNDIVARVAAAPGVSAAGAVSSLPLSGVVEGGQVRPVGRTYADGQGPQTQYNVVAGSYFTAAGIRLIAGRLFDTSDDTPDRATIIVSRTYARKQFETEANAVGREVNAMFEFARNRPPRLIVGVVDDVKQMTLEDEPASQVYVPVSQMPYPRLTLVVRTPSNPVAALSIVKRAVSAVTPTAMVNEVITMEDVVAQSLARQRFSMTLIGAFAGLALVLAIVGLYGVLALIVGQRQREIGVRLALGARPSDVTRMVVGEGARVAALGIVAGLAGAFALTRVLQSLLFGVSPTDVPTFGGASFVVGVVAIAATYIPARRAARVDPKSALTAE